MLHCVSYIGVSKNRGTPKWMVEKGKTLLKMDDLGGTPPIFGNTHIYRGEASEIPIGSYRIHVWYIFSYICHKQVTKCS